MKINFYSCTLQAREEVKHLKEEQELEVSLEVPKKEESTEVTLETVQIPLDVEETADIQLDVSETAEIPLDVSVDQEGETTAGFEVC